MKTLIPLTAAASLLIAGCTLLPGSLFHGGQAALTVSARVRDGGMRVQTSVAPYGSTDIRHLQIKVYKLVNGSEQAVMANGSPLMQDVLQASLSTQVRFTGLDYDTTYRVRAYAYRDSGTSNLISTTDSGSYVDISVGRDDRPTLANLPVRLIDTGFSGAATASAITFTTAEGNSAGTMSLSMAGVKVTTIAGSAGVSGTTDGIGTAARLKNPCGLVLDGSGNLYVADYNNNSIRKIVLATGEVTTVAGTTSPGFKDGIGTAARFKGPIGLALDGSGNLYVAEYANCAIRKIVLNTGEVTTIAGTASTGFKDGTGTDARFNYPQGLALDGSGHLFVADYSNNAVRQIALDTGAVTTLAGTSSSGVTDGIGTAAKFYRPMGLACDGSSALYVSDYLNHALRKIDLGTREVTTFAGGAGTSGSSDGIGTDARFNLPNGLALDGLGSLYLEDSANDTLRKVVLATGQVTTIAGGLGITGSADGIGFAARFHWLTAGHSGLVSTGAGPLYLADTYNHTLRKIAP